MSSVRANQKPESPVSTRPLSGISVGRTTSNMEMRSLATSSRRSSSTSYSSRTLPLATCTVASDMDRCLLWLERVDPLEDGVHVAYAESRSKTESRSTRPEIVLSERTSSSKFCSSSQARMAWRCTSL